MNVSYINKGRWKPWLPLTAAVGLGETNMMNTIAFIPLILLFYMLLYPIKIRIARSSLSLFIRVLLFCVVLSTALAYLYLLIADWDNDLELAILHWVGIPFVFLSIPIITFIVDITRPLQKPLRFIKIRSFVEVFVLTPILFITSAFVYAYLGWFYI